MQFQKAAEKVRERFGEVSEAEILAVMRAEREQAECKHCDGEPCTKHEWTRYWVPTVGFEDGKITVRGKLCDIGKRRRVRIESKYAFVPQRYIGKDFGDYDITGDNSRAVKMAKWFVKERPAQSLYFYGGYGTGKTFLAAIIAQHFMLDFDRVVFGDVPSLMEKIKQSFDTNAEPLNDYLACDLLILDDIGAGQITEWNVGMLYQIVNTRYNEGKQIIVTSNFDFEHLERVLKYATGKRIVSRLAEMCEVAFMGVKDRRL